MCKLTRTPINFLLHPLDIIGGDKIQQLAFFPGMNIDSDRKVVVFKEVLNRLKKSYRVEFISTLHGHVTNK
jgi:hypothetical protein